MYWLLWDVLTAYGTTHRVIETHLGFANKGLELYPFSFYRILYIYFSARFTAALVEYAVY